jgi:hypothetical protein
VFLELLVLVEHRITVLQVCNLLYRLNLMKPIRYKNAPNAVIDGEIFDLGSVGKIIGVGLNYRDHTAE